jgi:archaellum biogenesis ATPase FlaH
MWLTDQESDKETVVSPSLEGIIYIIEEFLSREKNSVLLLDGMEYLIGNNGFNPVLRFLRRLIDKISETQTILIITISPATVDERELKLLERELEPIPNAS